MLGVVITPLPTREGSGGGSACKPPQTSKTNPMKYEEALKELETIVRKMENDELDIDTLSEQLKRAQQLIKLCKDKLTKTDDEIKKILDAPE